MLIPFRASINSPPVFRLYGAARNGQTLGGGPQPYACDNIGSNGRRDFMMQHLGSIEGTAVARSHGILLGDVRYEISVQREEVTDETGSAIGPGMKSGDGRLTGPDFVLAKLFAARSVDLALDSGGTVKVIVTHFRPDEETAYIVVSGAVPGF